MEQSFTNLDFPEFSGFPFQKAIYLLGAQVVFSVAIIWPEWIDEIKRLDSILVESFEEKGGMGVS